MSTEKFTNNASTTLNGAINNAVTSLTPTATTGFPTAGNFRIRIDDEIMLVSAVSGGNFTVARAQEGTAAASHSNGATIRHVLTAGAIDAALGSWVEVVKLADETVASNSVLQDDDELFFTAASSVWYEVELYIVYASPAGGGTPDLKWAVGEDNNTGRGIVNHVGYSTADSGQNSAAITNNTSGGTNGTAATKRVVYIKGTILGNGGTWRFRWAQNTSGSNGTIVYATSKLRYRALDLV